MGIRTIAVNTFRENLREKVLYNLVVFALLLIGSAIVLSRVTLGDANRLVLDLGVASINGFGVMMAIFIGIGLVNKEIDKKTIYTIISKPIHRSEFVVGKYLGLCLTLLTNTTVMVVGLLVVLTIMEVPVELVLFQSILLIIVELMVVTAMALVFSSFTTAMLSAIFTLSIYVIGHLAGELPVLAQKVDVLSRAILVGLYYALPNLERLNLKRHVIHHMDLSLSDLSLIVAYGLGYAVVMVSLASIIFQRRDFR